MSQPNTLLHFRLKQGAQLAFGLGLVSLEGLSVKTKKVRFNILIVFVQIETLKPLSTQP